jgi:hypothetical protein
VRLVGNAGHDLHPLVPTTHGGARVAGILAAPEVVVVVMVVVAVVVAVVVMVVEAASREPDATRITPSASDVATATPSTNQARPRGVSSVVISIGAHNRAGN